ncbi:MAG TPA: glycerate kinase, partial [Syntrophales bacterium]|nr:glycerate kinase [Syntrophales bacterium]
MKDPRKDALAIFQEGLKAADPFAAVERTLQVKEDRITVAERSYDAGRYRRILVIGGGKAASPMARALEHRFGSRIAKGLVVTKYGHDMPLETVQVREAAHPVPDEAGERGARDILSLLEDVTEEDLVFCLLSGGGSALLPLPAPGITLPEKQATTRELLASGATIHEINAIRKHLSAIKGGGLAKAVWPGTLVSLILSDVIGDDLDTIASGPTVPDRSTFRECLEILDKYNLKERVPESVLARFRRGTRGDEAETPKAGDPVFEKTQAVIVGSAGMSLTAAREEARRRGYNTLVLSSMIEGETRDVARVHAAVGKEILKTGQPVSRPGCVISGGETTVTLRGKGLGGRNTEFVLAAAMEISGLPQIVVFSAGTDGTDGPTDAAGAVADGKTLARAEEQGL